jgi:thiol-disulfide isomerase/thioredoxin
MADPAADAYNVPAYYRAVNREIRRAYTGQVLRVGMPAPPFRLQTVDDDIVDLEVLRQDANVVVLFGCHSAPPCFNEMPRINAAADQFAGAKIVLVYTREIHPNEALAYGTFAHHTTMAIKTAAARRFRDELELKITVAVDYLDGRTHLAYGGLPFTAVVVRRDGIVAHREEWASASQLLPVASNLHHSDERRAGGATPRLSYSETLWSMEHLDKKP